MKLYSWRATDPNGLWDQTITVMARSSSHARAIAVVNFNDWAWGYFAPGKAPDHDWVSKLNEIDVQRYRKLWTDFYDAISAIPDESDAMVVVREIAA